MGFWLANLKDPDLQTILTRAWNDWAVETVIDKTDRVLPSAILPFLSVEDAVAEVQRVKELGFRAFFLPSVAPGGHDYALDRWEPLWEATEESGIVLAFHIGTGGDPVVYRGPGARSSTTGRPRFPVSASSPTSSPAAPSTGTRTCRF